MSKNAVTVRLYSHLAQVFGKREIEVQAQDLLALIRSLEQSFGEDAGSRLARCTLLLNGKRIEQREYPNTKLETGDRVDVLPPAAGG